jgi:hypothetical protein
MNLYPNDDIRSLNIEYITNKQVASGKKSNKLNRLNKYLFEKPSNIFEKMKSKKLRNKNKRRRSYRK